MSLDIGKAISEGVSRTFSKNGVLLAVGFITIALLTVVLTHTFIVTLSEWMLEFFQELSPAELEGVDQAQYEEMIADLEQAVENSHEFAPLAVTVPLAASTAIGLIAGGLLLLAVIAEAVSIIAVRVFATDETEPVSRDLVTDNLVLATVNGFIGGIVVWGLILVGMVFLLLPGLFAAVVFYFLRQEIALNDKNFIEAMADSWRVTKGNRFEVFALGLIVVVISQLDALAGGLVGIASGAGGEFAAAIIGGFLGVFGAAAVTRGYIDLTEEDDAAEGNGDEMIEDPYDAPLGPDDIPE